ERLPRSRLDRRPRGRRRPAEGLPGGGRAGRPGRAGREGRLLVPQPANRGIAAQVNAPASVGSLARRGSARHVGLTPDARQRPNENPAVPANSANLALPLESAPRYTPRRSRMVRTEAVAMRT